MPLEAEQIADRIRTILAGIETGASAELPDSMPLIGGNMDLDFLHVLLLITNIEKAFGVKIASQDVGKQAFASVGGPLIAFVIAKCQASPAAVVQSPARAAADPLANLPHQPPFRFVSTVTGLVPGVSEKERGRWPARRAFSPGISPAGRWFPAC